MSGASLVGSGSSTALTGSWIRINDIFPTAANTGPAFVPRSGTMLLNTGGYNPYRMGVVEFVFWLRGVTFTGSPTNVQLTLDVEEADDASGTNARPLARFVMGTGSGNFRRLDSVTPAAPAATQYVQVGLVQKQYLRWSATLAITAGSSPTVTYANCDLRARAMYADVEIRPPAE